MVDFQQRKASIQEIFKAKKFHVQRNLVAVEIETPASLYRASASTEKNSHKTFTAYRHGFIKIVSFSSHFLLSNILSCGYLLYYHYLLFAFFLFKILWNYHNFETKKKRSWKRVEIFIQANLKIIFICTNLMGCD